MKFFKLFILFFLFFSVPTFAQKVIKHKVKSGESIYSIAKKYDVTQSEIYGLNPKLKGAVLGLNAEVKIPNKKFKEQEKPTKKEVADKKANADKNDNLKNTEVSAQIQGNSKATHAVKAKETLYSISKKYGVTMETLCELNPELKTSNLKTGMKLQLPNMEEATVPEKVLKEENKVVETINVASAEPMVSNVDIVHKVLPKETLYGISRQTGVSIEEITRLNPSVANGLKIDQFLIIKKGTGETIENKAEVVEVQKEVELAKPLSAENLSKAELLIAKASEHIGTRYRRGGTSPGGFDCSGFMLFTFKNLDMSLPRTSHEMGNYGQRVERSQAQKGDLIFFATFGKGRISHVGMVTEVLDDEIKFIHSSTSQGVMISSTKEDYYARSFVKINRVLKD
ncbi:peptidoglycan endopeptidase [Flavobacterium sp.]|uniref:peptidoglycan endopeptidase n=1 Tax=Flavobacterium sp. TaxID=239 RepID=UPI0026247A20|nr:peptidoglycan endopeptidase [Flavobacterium sp.]